MKRQLLFLAAGAVALLASCTGSEPGASAGGMRTIEMTIGALTRGVYVMGVLLALDTAST